MTLITVFGIIALIVFIIGSPALLMYGILDDFGDIWVLIGGLCTIADFFIVGYLVVNAVNVG